MIEIGAVIILLIAGIWMTGVFFSNEAERIYQLEAKLLKTIDKEGLQLLLFSHGGVSTNAFAHFLEGGVGLKVRSETWGQIMHAPLPLHLRSPTNWSHFKGAIYIYGHPILSICSQKRRKIANENVRKLTLKWFGQYSDGRLMEAIYNQFKAWTNVTEDVGYPILRVFYQDLLHIKCLEHIFEKFDIKLREPINEVVRRRKGAVRHSRMDQCVKSLHLLKGHLQMAHEMDEYGGECEHVIPRTEIQWW